MNKISVIIMSLMLAASASAANNIAVKLEGVFDFQAAVRNQKNLGSDKKLTHNQNNAGLYSQSALRVRVTNETEEGMEYGAVFGIRTTSKTKVFGGDNGSYLFVQNDFGRLEAGSRQDAASILSQHAYVIAVATGDDWMRYFKFAPKIYSGHSAYNIVGSDYSYVYGGTFDSKLENSPEAPRAVTYYTPKLIGFQAGVTYTPDASNVGDGVISNSNGSNPVVLFDKTNGYNQVNANVSVKNMISAAITYEHNVAEDIDIALGFGITQGKTKVTGGTMTVPPVAPATDATKQPVSVKLANYKTYNVGAIVSYGNWSAAASYADEGKSFTAAQYFFDNKRSTKSYTAGVAYNQGPMGVSLTFLKSDKYKNKQSSYTLGTQYKIAPGLMPYFEVTAVQFKGRGYDMWTTPGTPVSVRRNTSGVVCLFGTKVSL